ncbi:MAG: phosphonoacetate hydrolase [Acidobacteriaceae bacterium]|nr:phosphonoacetate hydrolase [Acidobacteriaceae bacterium]
MPSSRRRFLKLAIACAAYGHVRPLSAESEKRSNPQQRTVVIMFDGFGLDYLQQSDMPTLRRWQRDGLYQQVKGVMPSVTNANNASICCGCFPHEHGITGNSYFDVTAGHEEYMEAAGLLLAPTLFERAAKFGVSSALLSSKKKTISLLRRGTVSALTAEEPSAEWVARLGPAPPIYSREINYWIVRAAIYILKHQPEIQCLYVHTTDYPMHTWAPDAAESREHLKTMDTLLGEAHAAAPDAQFLLTADHGMNHKTRAYDLDKMLARSGTPIRISISAERDRYIQHHRGLGGAAWIYLKQAEDQRKVMELVQALTGVESVLTREEAVAKFNLFGPRIGDLCVFGDKNTVFGEMEEAMTPLPGNYRSHGSRYELDIPLIAFNSTEAPPTSYFKHNLDLTRWLYRA